MPQQPKSSGFETTPALPASPDLVLLAATKAESVGECPYLATGEELPGGHLVLRPALPVTLLGGHAKPLAQTRALVDTGADSTTFSDEWADLLAIDLERDCEKIEVAVADGAPSIRYVFSKGVQVQVVGERLFLPIAYFCKDLPLAYLGRRDFFDRYLVLLDQSNFRFFLERRPDCPDDEDGDSQGDAALAAV